MSGDAPDTEIDYEEGNEHDYDNIVICAEVHVYLECKQNWAVSFKELFGNRKLHAGRPMAEFANDVLNECGITPVKHNGGVLLLELPDYLPLLAAIRRENRVYEVATDWPELECTKSIEEILNDS